MAESQHVDVKTITLAGLMKPYPDKPSKLEERFQIELEKVLDNIDDPNAEAEKSRRITIVLTFIPAKDRRACGLAVEVSSKLVERDGLYTDLRLGKDRGQNAVVEGPYQETIFDHPEPAKPRVLPVVDAAGRV